jgi:hypothetical protein
MTSLEFLDTYLLECCPKGMSGEGRTREAEPSGDSVDLGDQIRFERHLYGLHYAPYVDDASYANRYDGVSSNAPFRDQRDYTRLPLSLSARPQGVQ